MKKQRDEKAFCLSSSHKLTKYNNVNNLVVERNLCVGCGTCAGLCPNECLEMRFNSLKEYVPVCLGDCVECGLCLDVCPFYNNKENEDTISAREFKKIPDINHTEETGYYLKCYVGAVTSESRRWSRSSGGIASWVLSGLLKTRRVDRVVCVVQDDDPTRRFRFRVIEDPEDLWNASTSCYQQVEFSELLRNILYDEDQVRYAIIALPCVLKSLRLTMLKVPELSERVVFLAGLTCGQLKSRLFTDYLVRASGIDENQACDVSFREKIIKPDGMFHFTFSCKSRSSRKGKILLHHFRDYHYAWDMGYFKINACNYCDDLFAEVADVVFMDAWLPEYTCEEAGTNIVLVRNDAINEILRNGIENGEVNLDNIPVSKVISSQSGGLSNKGKELAARLTFADNKGWEIPIKRVIPSRRITIVKKFNILFSIYIMNRSKQAMVEQIQSQPGLKVFYYRMIGVQFMDRCLLIMSKLLRIFFRTRGREKSV